MNTDDCRVTVELPHDGSGVVLLPGDRSAVTVLDGDNAEPMCAGLTVHQRRIMAARLHSIADAITEGLQPR